MILGQIAKSNNDEYYTPEYAIIPIAEYLSKDLKHGNKVWCPFDRNESLFVKVLEKYGFDVINTHIDYGQDFFEMVPFYECDYIISNPPYSRKTDVLKRLFEIGMPFAMLCGIVGLFEGERFNLFKENDFEIMYFNKRIDYFKDYSHQKETTIKGIPYSSVYICHHILPKQIVFEELDKRT